MILRRNGWIRLVFVSLTLATPSLGDTQASQSTTPVRNFQPSLAAAEASATAVVVRRENNVLLFIRSPKSNVWKPSLGKFDHMKEVSGLRMAPAKPSPVQFGPSWLSIGPNSICAMTGLASDVEHLSRILQKQVDSHYNLYNKAMTTHSMTLGMADTFTSETFSGNRPFGVQCLLVGGDDLDANRIFGVYTINPSGVWQSWGGTTAIGKYAKNVRQELAETRKDTPNSLKGVLQQIIKCWKETCAKQGNVFQIDDDYQALVLHKNGKRCDVFVVDPTEIDDVIRSMAHEEKA